MKFFMDIYNINDVVPFMENKKVVFVTGVTGQDGSFMVDYLLDKTDCFIVGGARRLSIKNHKNIRHLENNPRFKLVNFDLSDAHSISKIVEKLKPDYFINLAAQTFVGSSWDFPAQTWECNTTGVIHILEAIRLHKPSCRFYNAGSSEEYGNVAYVPQDVALSNGTFRENLTMGYPVNLAPDELCWDALRVAQLDSFVRDLPLGLDQPVGERGTNLSGGQRQRLGIARAMLTKPKLLVLDEATSALDGQTELDISNAINNLKGIVTVVMIAHRLSTVRNSDQVIYMDKGKIVAKGKFEEVRKTVPDFDRQAQLMGL